MSDNNVADTWAKEFGMRPSVENTKYLMEILATTKNPHKHRHQDLAALIGSIDKVGFKNVIALWQDPQTGKAEVIYGGGRIETGDKKGMERLPVVWMLDFDKAKAKFLRVADNRVQQLAPAYDDDILIDHLKDLKLDNFEYDFLKLEKYDKFLINDLAADDPLFEDIMPGYAEMANGPTHAQDAEPVPRRSLDSRQPDPLSPPHNNELPQELSRHDVPDILFPADDTLISIESNVPMLSLKYQAEGYIPPLTKWGEVSRKDKNVKTWVFYIDDVKFVNLWYDPTGPLQGNAVCCVEPNFSTSPEFPRALALGDIYKKRWIARYWQSKGMKIIVDINIDQHLYDIALLGVPKGWRAYATRGQTSEIPTILTEYELAKERAGSDDLFFMVYGGGKKVEELCRGRGWTWVPERMDQVWHPEKNSDGLPIKVERG